jgi:ATP-binding cassette subfamily B protein
MGTLVGTGAKASNFKATLKRFLGSLRAESWLVAIVVVLSVLSVAATTVSPKIMATALNHIYDGVKTHHIDMGSVARIIVIVSALYFLSSLFMYLQNYILATVIRNLVYRLRQDIDHKLARLPLKYFDDNPRGDILSRITNDIDNIQQTLQQTFSQIVTSALTLVGILGVMFYMNWVLGVVSLIVVPSSVLVTLIIAKRSQRQFALQWKTTGSLNGHVEEMFTGHNIVKVFGRQHEAIEKFDEINDELYVSSFKAQFVSGLIMPSLNIISNLNYIIICVLGAVYVVRNTMSFGDVVAFIQYSRSFSQPITQVASVANVLQSSMASAERVFEILDEPEEIADPVEPVVLVTAKGHVQFEDVSFRYLPDVPLIDNLNLEVKPGQTVAIVGPTGAGKTTLVNLLMRFYEIDNGRILVDGVDTRDMNRDDLRKLFGMVLQDSWLFGGTIRENIAYGKENATEEEIIAASETAHADHFIRTLSAGYETRVDDDSTNLSQGERQLLTIARAFLAEPDILILDEATSSVDTRTELLIQKGMAKLAHGRTSFVIAHRLSTIREADVILVMNEGAIIEQGTHGELLAAGGFYAELYNSQFTGAFAEAG